MLPIISKCRHYTTQFLNSNIYVLHFIFVPFGLGSSTTPWNGHCNNTISNDNDNRVVENACIATNTISVWQRHPSSWSPRLPTNLPFQQQALRGKMTRRRIYATGEVHLKTQSKCSTWYRLVPINAYLKTFVGGKAYKMDVRLVKI